MSSSCLHPDCLPNFAKQWRCSSGYTVWPQGRPETLDRIRASEQMAQIAKHKLRRKPEPIHPDIRL